MLKMELPPSPRKPTSVPGQPSIDQSKVQDVNGFLKRELSTSRLDAMYSKLWLVSSRNNISPLHHQAIKGRGILITERPDLHLVWYYDRIFIKPIPLCLLDKSFFAEFLAPAGENSRLREAANGFLRTYARLIVHETDFELAKTQGLIPRIPKPPLLAPPTPTQPQGVLLQDDGAAYMSWSEWCGFIEDFRNVIDDHVTKRYEYGELRLTRLNFYSKVLLKGAYFARHTQHGMYFGRFMGPYLFLFGGVALVLTAMQVALAAESEGNQIPAYYRALAYRFSNFSLLAVVIGLAFFPLLYMCFQFHELMYAVSHMRKS